jgi:putative salt-induced outer membrane protein YdiY
MRWLALLAFSVSLSDLSPAYLAAVEKNTSAVAEDAAPPVDDNQGGKMASSPTGSATALPDLSWVPPEDSFDWIQLKSGEWLKGRLKAMQDRQLEFESEELDDLTIDWKDIRQVRSARALNVLLADGTTLTGRVAITPDEIAVQSTTPRTAPRELLQSLTPGGNRERDYWSGSASMGLTLRSGNTSQVEYNAKAHLQRRTPATRLSLDYIGNVSETDGIKNAYNHRVNTEFDFWLTKRFYLILPQLEYYKDPFQNLTARVTGGVGLGYDIVDRPNLEWNISTGPAYQKAWFESSQPGEPTESASAALNLSSRFDWDITRRIELLLEYRGQLTKREIGETTHHFNSTLSVELNRRFDVDISFVWDRINNPKIGEDDVRPKPDDFRLVFGLGVDF